MSYKKFHVTLLSLTVLLFPGLSFSQLSIAPFTAEYDVFRNGLLVGHTVRKLSKDGQTYEFTSATKTVGLAALLLSVKIQEKSILKLENNHFYLREYQYSKTDKKTEKFTIRYQPEDNTFYHSQIKKTLPAHKKTYDMLSFVLGIMSDISMNTRHLHYLILESNKTRDYLLKITKNPVFISQGKKISTQKLEQVKLPGRDQFIFWCAGDFDYLPVKILKIENDGDEILMQLTSYNNNPIQFNSSTEE